MRSGRDRSGCGRRVRRPGRCASHAHRFPRPSQNGAATPREFGGRPFPGVRRTVPDVAPSSAARPESGVRSGSGSARRAAAPGPEGARAPLRVPERAGARTRPADGTRPGSGRRPGRSRRADRPCRRRRPGPRTGRSAGPTMSSAGRVAAGRAALDSCPDCTPSGAPGRRTVAPNRRTSVILHRFHTSRARGISTFRAVESGVRPRPRAALRQLGAWVDPPIVRAGARDRPCFCRAIERCGHHPARTVLSSIPNRASNPPSFLVPRRSKTCDRCLPGSVTHFGQHASRAPVAYLRYVDDRA